MAKKIKDLDEAHNLFFTAPISKAYSCLLSGFSKENDYWELMIINETL